VNAKDVIQTALASTKNMTEMYLGDLSDADLLVRPVPKANTIAWQLGHVIAAEVNLVRSQIPDASYPELPAGFAEAHTKETASSDSPKGFKSKAEYLELFTKVRTGTLAALDKLSDADLSRPTQGQMASFAPKLADFFILLANHVLMHTGQFTVLRRKLGKPVLF
jgi:hypothetical protein